MSKFSNFGSAKVTTATVSGKEDVKLNKYLTYGENLVTITDIDFKESKTGKHLMEVFFETKKVEQKGFEADNSAINGGQVGKATMGIWVDYSDVENIKKLNTTLGVICAKMGVLEQFKSLGEVTMEEMVIAFLKIVKNKYAWFMLGAEEYVNEPKARINTKLFLFQQGFIVSENETFKTKFDINNKWHYKKLNEEGLAKLAAAEKAQNNLNGDISSLPTGDISMPDVPMDLPTTAPNDLPF
jgi:hypothetical protein